MLLVSTDSYFIRRADFDSWTIVFLFGIAAAIALFGVHGVTRSERTLTTLRRSPAAYLLLAVLASASQIAFTAAVNNTAVSNVVVIVAATPMLAAIAAWLILREPTQRRVQIAIAVVLVGVGIVVSGSLGQPTLDGDLLAVLAIVMFAVSVVVWRRHPELDRALALALSSTVTAVIAAPFASPTAAPLRVFVAVGLMGLLFNSAGRLAYSAAPKYAPASEVALFAPVETLAATAWAWWFFAEAPSTRTVVGGVIVLGAVLWGTVGDSR